MPEIDRCVRDVRFMSAIPSAIAGCWNCYVRDAVDGHSQRPTGGEKVDRNWVATPSQLYFTIFVFSMMHVSMPYLLIQLRLLYINVYYNIYIYM